MKERIKHDYTNEVELKSLVIRERNKHLNTGSLENNELINALIQQYLETKDPKLKDTILEVSKETQIDSKSHERFGEIVLLMIRKILTKPNYSGYSWADEFYSNSCYRVFKYIHNFDCDKKSERTGQSVSAFSYITQIIVMSILEVINRNNKAQKELDAYAEIHDSDMGIISSKNESTYTYEESPCKEIILESVESLKDSITEVLKKTKGDLKIYYPKDYVLSFDEYAEIRPLIKQKRNVSLIKLKI